MPMPASAMNQKSVPKKKRVNLHRIVRPLKVMMSTILFRKVVTLPVIDLLSIVCIIIQQAIIKGLHFRHVLKRGGFSLLEQVKYTRKYEGYDNSYTGG